MTNLKGPNKRIGIVLSTVPGYSETFFRNKIKGLQDNGMDVTLFADYGDEETSNQAPCKVVVAPNFEGKQIRKLFQRSLILAKALCLNPRRSLRLFKLERKDGRSFVHSLKNLIRNQYLLEHDLDWLHFGYGMLATDRENVAEAIHANMAVSFRGFDLYLSPVKHDDCYGILFSKQVKYHVLSNKMKERLVSHGIDVQDIHVITPAIDISLFNNENNTFQKPDKAKILCVSRLHWVKGLHYLIDALGILRSRQFNFELTVIGEGEERERLMFAAHQNEISDRVNFIGKIPHDEVVSHLKSADIYVQYSIQEGFGNSVLEAQAMGLLCVVSDADGLLENVKNGETGWIVKKRDPGLLARQIMEVHHLELQEKQKISSAAVQRVRQDFNLSKQNQLFLEFYKS